MSSSDRRLVLHLRPESLEVHENLMLVANMSHEIRTPIQSIIGYAELLGLSKLSNTQEEYLDIIKSSSEHLLAIINDILDLSKFESNRFSLNQEFVDTTMLVRDIFAKSKVLAQKKRHCILPGCRPLN
jgi:signal transduction histidine kinase